MIIGLKLIELGLNTILTVLKKITLCLQKLERFIIFDMQFLMVELKFQLLIFLLKN